MKDTTQFKIFGELDQIKQNYEGTSLEKISGLTRSQADIIKMCEYYSDSRYLGTNYGNSREIAGGKISVPFYNIVNWRVSLAKTATDLDIKDIQVTSDNPKFQTQAMLLNHEAYEWMKDSGFSKTLNVMGLTRPKYGGYLVKKCMEKGKLELEVVRWSNVWTDQNDILGGAIVECHHMSPVEIKGKDGSWDNVIDVLKAHRKIKPKDRPTVINVYEITGEFPISLYKNAQDEEYTEEEDYTFSLQQYFIADIDGEKFLLYSNELSGEMEDYYEYLSWEDNGYGLGRGVIEDLEEAQIWTNDAVINESIAMALAGRVGIKTTSKKLGNNVLAHDHGKIYEMEAGTDINSFSLAPSALGQYQNQIEKWRAQGDNATASYNSITGGQPPAGTPYSQTALLNQVATKPFEYRRQEWGIHLTKLFTNWIIPYLIKKIKKEHILVSDFTEEELDTIDESFANLNTNKDLVKEVFNVVGGQSDPNTDLQGLQAKLTDGYRKDIKKLGKKRYLEIPEDYFTDIETKITVITTGEQKNKSLILQGLSDLMRDVIASFNPTTGQFGVIEDPTLSKLFNQRLELLNTGITPADIGKGALPTKQVPQAPTSPVASGMPMTPAMSTPMGK